MSIDTAKAPAGEAEAALPAPPGNRTAGAFRRVAEIVLSFALLVAVLEGVVDLLHVETYVFPAPSAVAVALWRGIFGGGHYLYGLYVTMTEVLSGFALGSLAGIALGICMVSVKPLERIVYPYVVAIQTIPKVAIAPLMIVWFGFGIESKILMVALTCLFPSLVGTIAGIRGTDSDRISLIQAMRGSRLQLLRYVQLPSALPYIMAGLNTGIVLAVIGAIVGEFVGARSGMGVLILQANFALDLAAVFALLVLLGATGIILSMILRAIEARLCFWSGKTTK
jgi:NitT/TauT family transport system permease protein